MIKKLFFFSLLILPSLSYAGRLSGGGGGSINISGGGYSIEPATVTIQATQGITGTYGRFTSSVTAPTVYAPTLMRVGTLSSALGGVTPRFAAVGPDANILLAISTGTLGSGSGAGIQAWAWDTPTSADQRLGFYTFGSAYGGGTASNGAGIFGFSGGAWSAGVTQPTYLRAEVTPGGTTTRITAQHWEKSGQSVFNKNGSISVSSTVVVIAGSSGQTAPLTRWDSTFGVTASYVDRIGAIAPYSRTLSQLGALTPSTAGLIFYCSDCTVDGVVVSTGTAIGSFARISARTTPIQ